MIALRMIFWSFFGHKILPELKTILTDNHYKTMFKPVRIGYCPCRVVSRLNSSCAVCVVSGRHAEATTHGFLCGTGQGSGAGVPAQQVPVHGQEGGNLQTAGPHRTTGSFSGVQRFLPVMADINRFSKR